MATNLTSITSGDQVSRYSVSAELVIPATAKDSSTASLSTSHMIFPVHNTAQSIGDGRSSTTAFYDGLHEALLDAKQTLNDALTRHVDSLQAQLTPFESITLFHSSIL